MTIEFGLVAPRLEEQLAEFNLPKEKIDRWQIEADFVVSAHFQHAITDACSRKCNQMIGREIAKAIKEKYTEGGE